MNGKKTIITLESYGSTYSAHIPEDSDLRDTIRAFVGLMWCSWFGVQELLEYIDSEWECYESTHEKNDE